MNSTISVTLSGNTTIKRLNEIIDLIFEAQSDTEISSVGPWTYEIVISNISDYCHKSVITALDNITEVIDYRDRIEYGGLE